MARYVFCAITIELEILTELLGVCMCVVGQESVVCGSRAQINDKYLFMSK
jgi:hypothetical protein